MITEERMHDIARGAIEQNLGDCVDEDGEASSDTLYDNAFVLAHDALIDSGIDAATATRIAQYEAQCIAQP
jgi:hypothetical protein